MSRVEQNLLNSPVSVATAAKISLPTFGCRGYGRVVCRSDLIKCGGDSHPGSHGSECCGYCANSRTLNNNNPGSPPSSRQGDPITAHLTRLGVCPIGRQTDGSNFCWHLPGPVVRISYGFDYYKNMYVYPRYYEQVTTKGVRAGGKDRRKPYGCIYSLHPGYHTFGNNRLCLRYIGVIITETPPTGVSSVASRIREPRRTMWPPFVAALVVGSRYLLPLW